MFTNGVSDGQIRSVKIITKYQQKKYAGVSISIRQFSDSDSQSTQY
jgi:hypothetical protein